MRKAINRRACDNCWNEKGCINPKRDINMADCPENPARNCDNFEQKRIRGTVMINGMGHTWIE